MEKMRDVHVREVLLDHLHENYNGCSDTRIINELGINFGQSRVDVAVVNGIIHGYEIKSESDNLNRLPNQMLHYNKLFERMTIVVDQKHFSEVVEIVPKWWGITMVKSVNGKVFLIPKRKGRKKTSQDKETLLKLLWKDELEELIDFLELPKNMKKIKKAELLELFIAGTKIDVIRPFVYNALKKRQFWRI